MRKMFTTLKSVVAVALIAAMTLAASCSYDDSAIKERVSNVEKDLKALTDRVAALEKKLQGEVDALKALIDGQVVVVDVVTDEEGNQTIKLSDGKEITVLAPTQDTPCDCDPLQYRVINGVLEVSADGENWVAVNGVAAECVVANIVLNDDNTATITLANGESFTVVKAELIEFEATRTQVYVAAGTTKAIPFSINDAVVAIDVMNQPFGWSATVEEAVAEDNNGGAGIMPLAAGGKNYVLKVNGPAHELVNAGYAAKEGIVSVHFNTAAGACKVANVAVTLAELTLNVDVAGNVTITNSLAVEQTNHWGEVFVDFADFWIGVMPKALYDTYGVDALRNDAGMWGDFNSSYVTQRSTGLWNVAELQQYQEGVYEKETITLTVDQLGQAFYPTFVPQIGGEYVIFISTESEVLDYYQIPLLDNAIFASYKKTIVEASLVEGSETWNDATFNFNLAGFDNFLIGWMSVAEVEMYMGYGMGSSIEEILPQYISAYGVMSSGAILAGNYLDQTIKLSELAGMSLMEWAPSLATNTEYYFYVYPFNAQTEMEFYQHTLIPENLYYFGTFATAALVAGEFDANAQFEVVSHEEKEISVNVTLSEDVVSVAYNWYASEFMDPEEAVATIMGDEYYTTFITLDETKSFLAEDYDYYGLNNPTYLGIVAINAAGEYVYVEKEFTYVEPVLPQVAITSFEFLGRSYDLDDDASTAGGDYVYALTCEDGTQYKLGLYYSYANEDGSIIEGTYEYRTNTLNAMYSYWSGFVVVAEETYPESLLIVTADTITWKIKGVVEYVFNKNAAPVEPEENLIYTTAAKSSGWTDFELYLYGTDNTTIVLNPMGMCTNDQHYFTPGTYYVNDSYGNFGRYQWSYIMDNTTGAQTGIYDGTVVISVVDEMYRIEMDLTVGSNSESFVAVFQGVIEGMDLPGEQGGDEPENPEQPEEPFVSENAVLSGGLEDCTLTIYSADGNKAIVLNFYKVIFDATPFIPVGTYNCATNAGCVYTYGYSYIEDYNRGTKKSINSGNVVVSEVDGKYNIVVAAVLEDNTELNAEFTGTIEGLILPSEYVQPEPETIEMGEVNRAKWTGSYLQTYSADGRYCAVYYLYGMVDTEKGYLPAGTYYVGYDYPGIYASGYSRLYDYEAGSYTHNFDEGGVMTVAEVNGAYHIEFNGTLSNGLASMEYVFEGAIENLILPSEYKEPVVLDFVPVRAEYDNKFDLYEYNGGDAEYAFWLYDANNNYVEVIHRFGSHTGWDDVYEAKYVGNGVEYVATKVTTQAPNTWNCNAGENYFVVSMATADYVFDYSGQLPSVEVNYLGEGSTYAPGSDNPGVGGGDDNEEELVATELTIVSHYLNILPEYGETEVYFKDSEGSEHVIDFVMEGIVAGNYTSANDSILVSYSLYKYGSLNVGLTSAEGTITDNGDTTFTFDVTFVAEGAAYHFTYTTPVEEVEEPEASATTFVMTSKGAKYAVGSYAAGFLFSDENGDNQVALAVDDYYSTNGETILANQYATWQSSPSYIMNGSHFSFVNNTLKVNGVTYPNSAVEAATLTVVADTSITITATLEGVVYTFVYNL